MKRVLLKIENWEQTVQETNQLSFWVWSEICIFGFEKFNYKNREVRDFVEQLDNHLEEKSNTMLFNCLAILLKNVTYWQLHIYMSLGLPCL